MTFSIAKPTAVTNTTSSVAGSATVVTLLSANDNRLGATVYNDSSAVLYLKLGSTASSTDFTCILAGNGSGIGGYYEVPYNYTGIITGLWGSATGNARIGELT
jgi:flagellar hook assembly protein FlgD